MDNYIAFLSLEDQDGFMPESVTVCATDPVAARFRFRDMMTKNGYHVDLSERSEEVSATTPDGKEYIYFGFDLED